MVKVRHLAAFAVAVATAACGGAPPQTHNVKIDVGGSVVYALDPSEGLAGVAIVLTDVEGREYTATTNSAGLWTIENVLPGVYSESYSLAGYDPLTGTFSIPAGGENNVANVFITRPAVALEEEPLVATISPFSTSLVDGDQPFDGLGGAVLVYSSSGNADIVVSFTRRVVGGNVSLRDDDTGQQIGAQADATGMIWTFSEADIATINGGGVTGHLTVDQDPFTWHRIQVSVTSFTPLHGDLVQTQATARFNCVP